MERTRMGDDIKGSSLPYYRGVYSGVGRIEGYPKPSNVRGSDIDPRDSRKNRPVKKARSTAHRYSTVVLYVGIAIIVAAWGFQLLRQLMEW